jgi:Dolichyl-phosphate-mannose-protein mannosyltransferase
LSQKHSISRPVFVAASISFVAYLVIQVRWIFEYRRGLFDIDESGYLWMAFQHYHALHAGGFGAWVRSVFEPSVTSPLTPGVASLLFAVLGPDPVIGFLAPVLFGAIAVMATYLLGKQAGGQRVGLASAALLATTPLIVRFSRSFQFSIPATAITALALLSLLKSDRAGRWPWVIAFGVFVGLMPLARSMTIGFIPGIGAAALVYVFFEQDRFARIGRLLTAGVVAALTSLTWLWKSGPLVWWYLYDFGYGSRVAEYARSSTWLGSARDLRDQLLYQLFLPHVLVILVGFIAGIALSAKAIGARHFVATLRSPVAPMAVFSLLCLIVLWSTQNQGSAFVAPALPALYVAVVAWLYAIAGRAGLLVSLGVGAVAAAAFVPFVDLRLPMAAPFPIRVGSTSIVFTNGAGTEEDYEAANAVNAAQPERMLADAQAEAWKLLNRRTVERLGDMPTAVGFRGVVYNLNTIGLAHYLTHWKNISITQIEPQAIGDGLEAYKAWLSQGGAAGWACALLTSAGEQAEFRPLVNTPVLEQAASEAGFKEVDDWSMPNGRVVKMWTRPCPA